MKKIISLILVALFAIFAVSCGENTSNEDAEPSIISPGTPQENAYGTLHHVEMTFDGFGTVKLELYADMAPITVGHFIDLVKSGYYDGTSIIRVQAGFVVQGGKGSGTSTIKGEFSSNGVDNTVAHKRGVLSMARSTSMDSASDQFFICLNDESAKSLDGRYAAFGAVVEGMDIIDKIVEARNDINCLDLSNLSRAQIGFLNTESYVKILSAKVID